jgi:hypothetical protein
LESIERAPLVVDASCGLNNGGGSDTLPTNEGGRE